MLEGYRTIIFSCIGLIASILSQYDVEIDIAGVTNSVIIIGGFLGAIWFKLVANKREEKAKDPEPPKSPTPMKESTK